MFCRIEGFLKVDEAREQVFLLFSRSLNFRPKHTYCVYVSFTFPDSVLLFINKLFYFSYESLPDYFQNNFCHLAQDTDGSIPEPSFGRGQRRGGVNCLNLKIFRLPRLLGTPLPLLYAPIYRHSEETVKAIQFLNLIMLCYVSSY